MVLPVHEFLRRELTARRISQETAGRVMGLSQLAVSRRLRGTVQFNVDELTKLAELLGMTLSELITTAEHASAATWRLRSSEEERQADGGDQAEQRNPDG